jgi:BirA family biotin operon repressor/biotin-[acetyl-CoA-carboxylase] ligase
MPEPLPGELESALRASAGRRGPFGEPTRFFTETGSTNDEALALAERGAAEGTTCVAFAQRRGRGRLGRVWFSPPGAGLYASVVCRGKSSIPFLTLAAGVAAADGIRRATGLPVTIKWPNDVVVEGGLRAADRRKLAGILAEGPSAGGGVEYVVVGFGINVRRAAYPPEIAGRATSLETELGRAVDPGLVLAEVLVALNEQVRALHEGASGHVLRRWRELAPSAKGARVEWSSDAAPRRGVTQGIDDTGALLVRDGENLRRIVAGELTWL